MSKPPRRASRVFTISFPEELAKQVVAVADEESRNISELFREAFRTNRALRVRALLNESQEIGLRTNPMGYAADDVERLIHETRLEE